MADKIIKFTIKDGEVKQDLINFNGVGCKELSDRFSSLGQQTHVVLKPEIHNQETCDSKKTVTA